MNCAAAAKAGEITRPGRDEHHSVAMRVRLDPLVTALDALRLDGSDTGVSYPATGIYAPTRHRRHQSVDQIFRMAVTCGMVGEHQTGDYAVLDGENDDGDILSDYGIRALPQAELAARRQ